MSNTSPSPHVPEWTIGDRLRKARTSRKISTERMAEALGVDRKTVGNYESMRSPVSRGTVLAWSMITRWPHQWILTGHAPGGPSDGGDLGSQPTHWYAGRRVGTKTHLLVAA